MDLNKTNIKKLLGIITFAILLYVGLQHLNYVGAFFAAVFELIFPFLLGGGIAFILNVLMRDLEHRIFERNKMKNASLKKLKRPISLLLTLLIVIGAFFLVMFLVIPEIVNTIKTISLKSDDFVLQINQITSFVEEKYPDIAALLGNYQFDWEKIGSNIFTFLQSSVGNMLKSTFSIASSILGGMIDFFLGFIFAVYILLQKEKLGQQARKLIYAFLPEKAGDKLISIGSLSFKTFSRFLSGQCLEAVILATIFFAAMTIFQFPYALMISVLIGFMSLIPVFGAFIGCFIGAFLILIIDPVMALWFILLFIIIQQIEGNLIYPHVVGGSVGLPSMWVLVAVTIGGSTLGVVGMLIFIPISSVVYTILREETSNRIRLRKISKNKYEA